jgi:hypothetical protein
MSVYVRIKRLNGLKDRSILGTWLSQSGIIEVEYNEGGWEDTRTWNLYPHLKFEREEDATAYVLSHGGFYTRTIPEMIPDLDDILRNKGK